MVFSVADDPSFSLGPPAGTCPECGSPHDDEDALRAHMERHTGELARGSDDAGGVVPAAQQAQDGAGRVQTE